MCCVSSSRCLQLCFCGLLGHQLCLPPNRQPGGFFCDPRSNRNSVKNCIFREKMIEIILKITAKSFSLVISCHSSFIVLFYLLTRPEPPCTHLHPGCQLSVFSSNRARLEVGCAASNAAYPPVIITLTYLGICFFNVTAFHAFRFMRAVSKRWRTCLSPSRTRRALRRRSNSGKIKENQVVSNNAIPSLVFLGTQKATWYLFCFFLTIGYHFGLVFQP